MSSYLSEVKFGLLLALASFAWITVEYVIGLQTKHIELHMAYSMSFAVIPIVMMWIALVRRRDVIQGGSLTWGQGLASGMVISVVAAVLAPPSMYTFAKLVNPSFFATMSEYAVKSGQTTPDDAQQYFSLGSYMFQATMVPLVAGFATAVIETAIARWTMKAKK